MIVDLKDDMNLPSILFNDDSIDQDFRIAQMFEVYFVDGLEGDINRLGISDLEIEDSELRMMLDYQFPENISRWSYPDSLIIEFKNIAVMNKLLYGKTWRMDIPQQLVEGSDDLELIHFLILTIYLAMITVIIIQYCLKYTVISTKMTWILVKNWQLLALVVSGFPHFPPLLRWFFFQVEIRVWVLPSCLQTIKFDGSYISKDQFLEIHSIVMVLA